MPESSDEQTLKGCSSDDKTATSLTAIPQTAQKPKATERISAVKEEYYDSTTTVIKHYQKEAPRRLRFEGSNNDGDHESLHKKSRSCSPKKPPWKLELDERVSSSKVLQKKRERYHSQRHTTKHTPTQSHPRYSG